MATIGNKSSYLSTFWLTWDLISLLIFTVDLWKMLLHCFNFCICKFELSITYLCILFKILSQLTIRLCYMVISKNKKSTKHHRIMNSDLSFLIYNFRKFGAIHKNEYIFLLWHLHIYINSWHQCLKYTRQFYSKYFTCIILFIPHSNIRSKYYNEIHFIDEESEAEASSLTSLRYQVLSHEIRIWVV